MIVSTRIFNDSYREVRIFKNVLEKCIFSVLKLFVLLDDFSCSEVRRARNRIMSYHKTGQLLQYSRNSPQNKGTYVYLLSVYESVHFSKK